MQSLTKPHKAPGKAHRKGISLAELFRKFPADLAAERWFERSRWSRAKQNRRNARDKDTEDMMASMFAGLALYCASEQLFRQLEALEAPG